MKRTSRREFLAASSAGIAAATALPLTSCALLTRQSELSRLDGVGLAELVRMGEITPLELVEDTLARIEMRNPAINAVVEELMDPEVAIRRAGEELGEGPFRGVPVLLKNLNPYREARVDFGSRLFARAIAEGRLQPENSDLARVMLDSGMVIAGITNSPEAGLIDTTEPSLHGPTRNPWNLEYTAGGSSGGAAAAVAAGIAPFAHANDGGGSIRIPASHCGLFGLKPSRGREPSSDPNDLSLANDLCVSRTVRDAAAFLSMIERRDDSVYEPVGWVKRSARPKRLRIGVAPVSVLGRDPHPEVSRAVQKAVGVCEELGHEIREIELGLDGEEFSQAFIGLWSLSGARLVENVGQFFGPSAAPEDFLEPWTLGLAREAVERGGPDPCVERAVRAFRAASATMQAHFDSIDVLLTPVLRVPPYPIGHHDPMGDFDTILARVVDAVSYTPLQNATGMTGMSVPLHWTQDDLPVGIQFSAWRGGERTLLEFAYELEDARPWAPRLDALQRRMG